MFGLRFRAPSKNALILSGAAIAAMAGAFVMVPVITAVGIIIRRKALP